MALRVLLPRFSNTFPIKKYYKSKHSESFPMRIRFFKSLSPASFNNLAYSSSRSPSPPDPAHGQMDSCLKIAELKGNPAAAEGSNFVFSPLSLVAALSLTATGARGRSLQELLSFLGSADLNHLHSASAQLFRAFRAGDREMTLSFANGAWVEQSIALNPSIPEVAASIYGAVVEPVDFICQASFQRQKINDWIEKNTNGIIKNLLPDGSVNFSTRLILANALYFKGKWQVKFDCSMTQNGKFHLSNGRSIQVPFMSSREKQLISSYDRFKVLKLPYKMEEDGQENKRSFSMLLFLPDERDGLRDLIRRAVSDPNFIKKHVPRKRVGVGCFMVPKFRMSFDFEASEALKHLGLENIFDRYNADLKGICLDSLAQLYVSSIYHKASIEVDEEGATAAAATAVGMAACLRLQSPAPSINFVADHPFMFVVREEETGACLFLGHVANPSIQD